MPQVAAELREAVFTSPILMVDDSPINCIIVEKMLRARGFTHLRSVSSAEEALAILDSYRPELIILDVLMPGGMDGFVCCEEIRKRPEFRGVPILIQTALAEPEMRAQAFKKGAADFISKPVYPDELCARVIVHLERRQTLKSLSSFKARMDSELASARQLQQAILPTPQEVEQLRLNGALEVASVFRPSSEVGGDFWGIKTLTPQEHALWLVDFSGHGVASAINAFRLQAYMKERGTEDAAPGDYLTRMNHKLRQLLLRGQFATMFYGVIDAAADELRYACACAPHPLLLRAESGTCQLLDGSGLPLAATEREYHTQRTRFAVGDTLLLYSDALLETPNAQGHYLSEAELMAALEECRNQSAALILNRLLALFTQHSAAPLADDLTLVVCKRLPSTL